MVTGSRSVTSVICFSLPGQHHCFHQVGCSGQCLRYNIWPAREFVFFIPMSYVLKTRVLNILPKPSCSTQYITVSSSTTWANLASISFCSSVVILQERRTSYLGYMWTVRRCNSFMILRKGDMPLVMNSGWSEKAFKNPVLFFSLYSRTMNASAEVGVTLVRC